ncbi:glycosyltransferase family 2 protein [Azospirillum aestuarii]|uniref:glycosyltransferase family 2 protein n=1 Tax=Azospirillum aestuarii TaxID=2802052 RepID=UPI0040552CB9
MLRIFISCWNAGPYLSRCLRSIQDQSESEWTVHFYDDNSTDNSLNIMDRLAEKNNRINITASTIRRWQSGNLQLFSSCSTISDSDIVVQVDGDDWLPDPDVLTRIRAAYHLRPNVLMTYGNFIRFRNNRYSDKGYCRIPEDFTRLRELPWTTSALKTHRMGLLRRVRDEDYRDAGGSFLCAAGDLATGFPMLEMAGPQRALCLHEVNYVYNMDNPVRTPRVRAEAQRENADLVRSRQPYRTLSDDEVAKMLGG